MISEVISTNLETSKSNPETSENDEKKITDDLDIQVEKIIEEKFRLPPDAVASKVLHALESRYPKIRYKVTLPAYIMDFCVRFLPASYIDGFFKNKISSYIK